MHRTPILVDKRYVIKLQNVAKKIVTLMWWHIGHVYSINSNESRERSLWSSLPKRTNRNTAFNQRLLFICTHKYNFSCYIPNNRSKGRRSKFLFVGKRQKKGGGSSHFLVEQTDWEQRYRWGHKCRTQALFVCYHLLLLCVLFVPQHGVSVSAKYLGTDVGRRVCP